VSIFEEKLKAISYIEGVLSIKKWHLWCLDKSYRVCTIHVDAREDVDPDLLR
jgi:Co/Zn/Cd efflux system component